MPRSMLINSLEPSENRIAVIDGSTLSEIYIERAAHLTTVGNVYKARVLHIEKGLQAAFVDFGGRKNGFLHVSDIKLESKLTPQTRHKAAVRSSGPRSKEVSIDKMLTLGDELLVQVTKEGIGEKCPTVTSYVSIPGRYLVVMPHIKKRGVSRKITDMEERQRLKALMDDLDLDEGMGFIVRTAGCDCTKQELENDGRYLMRLWKTVERRAKRVKAPCCLYRESDLVIRTIRDIFSDDIREIIVDSEENYNRIKAFLRMVLPVYESRVKQYRARQPLFQKRHLEEQIRQIYERTVPLAKGGSIVIDPTEALVAIDVNSGSFMADGDPEMVAFETNKLAAKEIVRQLRLRDLGGVIVIDFIDMLSGEHRTRVEDALIRELKKDRARTRVLRMSRFCMVEMTRQRVRQSLKSTMYDTCPTCSGSGYIKSPESMMIEMMRLIRSAIQHKPLARMELHVSNQLADAMLNSRRADLVEIETQSGKQIAIHGHPNRPIEFFTVEYMDLQGKNIKL